MTTSTTPQPYTASRPENSTPSADANVGAHDTYPRGPRGSRKAARLADAARQVNGTSPAPAEGSEERDLRQAALAYLGEVVRDVQANPELRHRAASILVRAIKPAERDPLDDLIFPLGQPPEPLE
jgi:hypothetical protein